MVDCRPAAGPAPHDLAHSAPNGAPPETHHNQQAPASNEMGGHGVTSPASVRASTPATSNALTTYTGGNPPAGVGGPGGPVYSNVGFMGTAGVNGMGGTHPPGVVAGGPGYGGGCAPYMCGVKSLVWCAAQSPPPHAPHAPHAPPPPPHGVNPHVFKSVQANGADLPMNDIPTLRYYFNLGVECMWAAYGPPPPHPPPRHYSPRDLAQDMQQMGIHERPMNHNAEQNHKHKPQDKPQLNNQGKGNGQRPLLGPRFKRGGNNQDNNQTNNHNQNKGHNNNMGNKGPNNRRNSHPDGRGPPPHAYSAAGAGGGAGAGAGAGDECVEAPLLTLPYIPYPPPIYPIPYYPLDSDPAMMGMMGGMGYVGYEEGVEYGAPLQYYPPPPPPHYPPHPHPHPHAHPHHQPQPQAQHQHHQEHK